MNAGQPRDADAFVEHVERCRERLAAHLAGSPGERSKQSAALTAQRLTHALVFVRFCEERRVLAEHGLERATGARGIVDALDACLRGADEAFHGWLLGGTSHRLAPALGDGLFRELVAPLASASAAFDIETLGRLYESALDRMHRRARKSGGVYYTPAHVVRYMVDGTLGRLLEGLTPEEVTKVRVLDPACGSGSFLLGVFERLIGWYRSWYAEHDPDTHAKGPSPSVYLDRTGTWQLTAKRRVAILLDNIYGVDLDERAIDVTRLSLALRALEGQLDEGTTAQEALESLRENVRPGNSLVEEEFNYGQCFREVFADGGFDVVLGNPPYVSYGGRQAVDISAGLRRYFAEHYESGGWATAHSLFMERSVKDLTRRLVSFIVPDQVGHLAGYGSLRALLARHGRISEVKYWGEDVFKGVVTPALTFLFDKGGPAEPTRIRNPDGSEHHLNVEGEEPWIVSSSQALIDKLRRRATTIRPYLADCGVRTTDAKKQVVDLDGASGRFMAVLEGKQIGRYSCLPPEVAVRLDTGCKAFVSREEKYEKAEFLIRQTAAYPIVGPREHATYFRNSLHALYPPDNGWDVRYIVGLLNSKLLRFAYVANVREARQRVFPQVKLGPLGALPIRALRVDRGEERTQHDRLVALVAEMLELKHAQKRGPGDDALRSRAEQLDARIDAEVFRLYELTDDEIQSVEETVSALAAPP